MEKRNYKRAYENCTNDVVLKEDYEEHRIFKHREYYINDGLKFKNAVVDSSVVCTPVNQPQVYVGNPNRGEVSFKDPVLENDTKSNDLSAGTAISVISFIAGLSTTGLGVDLDSMTFVGLGLSLALISFAFAFKSFFLKIGD